jgi:hypothetical protein
MRRALTACLLALLAGGTAAGGTAAGCSDDGSSSSASASSASASVRAAALCSSVDGLQGSVVDLQNVDVVENGVSSTC